MVFSSLVFLFRFMAILFPVYYLTPKRLKNVVLLTASLIFYSWGEVRYFPIMLSVISVNYVSGLGLERYARKPVLRKVILWTDVVFSVGFLAVFKYADFFIGNINTLLGTSFPLLKLTLPLGISFYTFQILTYTVDVYLNKIEAEHNIINFGTFVVLFPQLIAGPIVKYTDIHREVRERTVTLPDIEEGIKLFIMGLGSKVLIANSVGALWTQVRTIGFDNVSTPLAWLGVTAFSLQIYYDFSGYSLMALGMGRMMGFHFPKNFDYPYIAKSITGFWRRWHMTLSGWFREYVYFPLGGSRCGKWKSFRNLLIVWALTGFWHGANWNFILWGLLFFVVISLERLFWGKFMEEHAFAGHIYTLFVIVMSFAVFDLPDFTELGSCFTRMYSFTGGIDWMYYLRNYAGVLALAILFCMPVVNLVRKRLPDKLRQPVEVVFCGFVLVVSVAYLVDSSYNPFLYYNF